MLINGKRYKALVTYLRKDMPEGKKEYLIRQLRVTILSAKNILAVNTASDSFDAFRYKGGLITCLEDLRRINNLVISDVFHIGYSAHKITEIYELTLKLEEALRYTNELILSLRAQGNYEGTYKIEEVQHECRN